MLRTLLAVHAFVDGRATVYTSVTKSVPTVHTLVRVHFTVYTSVTRNTPTVYTLDPKVYTVGKISHTKVYTVTASYQKSAHEAVRLCHICVFGYELVPSVEANAVRCHLSAKDVDIICLRKHRFAGKCREICVR